MQQATVLCAEYLVVTYVIGSKPEPVVITGYHILLYPESRYEEAVIDILSHQVKLHRFVDGQHQLLRAQAVTVNKFPFPHPAYRRDNHRICRHLAHRGKSLPANPEHQHHQYCGNDSPQYLHFHAAAELLRLPALFPRVMNDSPDHECRDPDDKDKGDDKDEQERLVYPFCKI